METLCIKVEDELLDRMNVSMKKSGYSTKTEFIREAIREKLDDDEKEMLVREFLKFRGKSKKKTSDEELEKIKQRAFEELAKERAGTK